VGIETSSRSFREQVSVPVQVILDVLGGPAFQDNLAVLAPRGRLVMLGFLQGPLAPQANLDVILRKRLEVIGTAMRSRGSEERAALAAEFRTRVLPLFGPHIPTDEPMHSLSHPARVGALLRPIVHAVYPMAKLAEAHRAMEGDQTIGKVVVTWGSV
jgi:NADPH:quinone reductase-like Zn-dependent oxidoreductase